MVTHRRSDFFAEVRRRRVLPVSGTYIAIAWLVTEMAGFLLQQAGAPGWTVRLLAIGLVAGLPVTVTIAWVLQKSPAGGLAVDSPAGSITAVLLTLVLGAVATAGLAWLILPRVADRPGGPRYEPLPNSLAIVPLDISDGTPNARAVNDTLYEALLDGLDQSDELSQVQLRLKAPPADPAAFGRKIRVQALLAGRVGRSGEGTIVEMHLLNVGRATRQWSQTFAWDSTRIMELGTAIANGVLDSMGLPSISRERFAGTTNREAYDEWLVGHSHFAAWTLEGLERAMRSYQRAIELDPGFARAHLALASAARLYSGMKGAPADQREAMRERARKALDAALSLDDRSAGAVSMLGLFTENRSLRMQLWQRALELDPAHAPTYFRLGWEEWEAGHAEEAARLMRRALDYRPMDANIRMDLAKVLWSMGLDDEARREIQTAIDYRPDMSQPYMELARWSYLYGHLDEAIVLYHRSHTLDPKAGWVAGWLANAWAELGARQEALEWLRVGETLMPSGICAWAWGVHWQLGDIEAARRSALEELQIHPDNTATIAALARWDVDAGRADRALAAWERREPNLATDGGETCHPDYGYALLAGGRRERALRFVLPCLRDRVMSEDRLIHYYAEQMSAHALLGNRAETLDYLAALVVEEGWRRISDITLKREFGFLAGDPEFERLMNIMREDLSLQRERLRSLVQTGELRPAAGLDRAGEPAPAPHDMPPDV